MKIKTKKKRTQYTLILSLLLLLLLLGILLCGYQFQRSAFYEDTRINGLDCSNKTVDEVNQLLQQQLSTYTLTISGPDCQSLIVQAQAISLTCDMRDELTELLRTQIRQWVLAKKKYVLQISVQYDNQKLDQLLVGSSWVQNSVITPPQNAHIQQTGEIFSIISEQNGTAYDTVMIAQQVKNSIAKQLQTYDIRQDTKILLPTLTKSDKQLQKICAQLNQISRFHITCDFGNDRIEEINFSDVVSALSISDASFSIDTSILTTLVNSWAASYDTFGLPRQFQTHNGETITLPGGDYGWALNIDETVQQIYSLLMEGYQGALDPIYNYTAMSRENHDLGGTYVEISINEQKMYCYQDYQLLVETDVVTGLPTEDRMTHTGCYAIDTKNTDCYLTGADYRTHVNYWMPFHGNEGIHDLERTSYGGNVWLTNGSHGCVNTPIDAVRQIYEIVSIGTPVVVYGY